MRAKYLLFFIAIFLCLQCIGVTIFSIHSVAEDDTRSAANGSENDCESHIDPALSEEPNPTDVRILNALVGAGVVRGSSLKAMTAEALSSILAGVLKDVPKGSVLLSRLTKNYGGWDHAFRKLRVKNPVRAFWSKELVIEVILAIAPYTELDSTSVENLNPLALSAFRSVTGMPEGEGRSLVAASRTLKDIGDWSRALDLAAEKFAESLRDPRLGNSKDRPYGESVNLIRTRLNLGRSNFSWTDEEYDMTMRALALAHLHSLGRMKLKQTSMGENQSVAAETIIRLVRGRNATTRSLLDEAKSRKGSWENAINEYGIKLNPLRARKDEAPWLERQIRALVMGVYFQTDDQRLKARVDQLLTRYSDWKNIFAELGISEPPLKNMKTMGEDILIEIICNLAQYTALNVNAIDELSDQPLQVLRGITGLDKVTGMGFRKSGAEPIFGSWDASVEKALHKFRLLATDLPESQPLLVFYHSILRRLENHRLRVEWNEELLIDVISAIAPHTALNSEAVKNLNQSALSILRQMTRVENITGNALVLAAVRLPRFGSWDAAVSATHARIRQRAETTTSADQPTSFQAGLRPDQFLHYRKSFSWTDETFHLAMVALTEAYKKDPENFALNVKVMKENRSFAATEVLRAALGPKASTGSLINLIFSLGGTWDMALAMYGLDPTKIRARAQYMNWNKKLIVQFLRALHFAGFSVLPDDLIGNKSQEFESISKKITGRHCSGSMLVGAIYELYPLYSNAVRAAGLPYGVLISIERQTRVQLKPLRIDPSLKENQNLIHPDWRSELTPYLSQGVINAIFQKIMNESVLLPSDFMKKVMIPYVEFLQQLLSDRGMDGGHKTSSDQIEEVLLEQGIQLALLSEKTVAVLQKTFEVSDVSTIELRARILEGRMVLIPALRQLEINSEKPKQYRPRLSFYNDRLMPHYFNAGGANALHEAVYRMMRYF